MIPSPWSPGEGPPLFIGFQPILATEIGRRADLHADAREGNALDVFVGVGPIGEKIPSQIDGCRKIRIAGVATACQ